MCGIACILSKRAPLQDETLLSAMLDVQQHRGPDDRGWFISPFLQLGMVRLSIIDTTSSNLSPLAYRRPDATEPSHILSYNGEIFNYVELKRELQAKGHLFQTMSDTEVLLHAYLEWGEGCVDYINGMYAFVLADFDRDRLFLARDIAGEKPLYYYENRERLVIASEIKAILGHIRAPELHMTDEFRAFEYMTGAETLFKGVYALLPGHKMVVRGLRGNFIGHRASEYWSLLDHLYELTPGKEVDLFDELLHDSVKIRLRSDVPVGLYLSGGLDSSLLAAIARPQVAFTTCFDYGPKYDELSYAQAMAKHSGSSLVVIRPTKADFEASLDDIIYHLDMPVGSFSAFPLFMLAREARKQVKVVISGEGVDELFCGYTRYLLPAHDDSLYGIEELEHYHSLLDYYYGKPLDRFARLLNRGAVGDEVVKSVIVPYFNRFEHICHAMGYTEFKLMLVTLLHMEDRASAAFGLENRSPFLDKRIIAFAFSIPGSMKIRNFTTKWIVRELAKRYLPPTIYERKNKLGLIAPINIWMNFNGTRGEFDRRSYNQLCMERWLRVFFEERRFQRAGKHNAGAYSI